MKFGSVSASAGGLLTIHALAPGSFECRHLGGGVLVVGGHSGVANQHCIKAPRIELLIPFCNARMQQNRKCPLLQNRSFVQSPNFAGSRETDSAKAHHSGASRRRFDEFIILDAGKVLCKGLFATQPGISSARNCVQPYWGASTFMIQKLREHQHGWDHIERTAVGSAPYLGRKKNLHSAVKLGNVEVAGTNACPQVLATASAAADHQALATCGPFWSAVERQLRICPGSERLPLD